MAAFMWRTGHIRLRQGLRFFVATVYREYFRHQCALLLKRVHDGYYVKDAKATIQRSLGLDVFVLHGERKATCCSTVTAEQP